MNIFELQSINCLTEYFDSFSLCDWTHSINVWPCLFLYAIKRVKDDEISIT